MADPLGLISPGGTGPIQGPGSVGGSTRSEKSDPVGGFKDVLLKNIEQVNRLQEDAQMAIEDLTAGRRDDVASVMIAKQKADLAFQMLLEVRNKLVDAYEEVRQIRV